MVEDERRTWHWYKSLSHVWQKWVKFAKTFDPSGWKLSESFATLDCIFYCIFSSRFNFSQVESPLFYDNIESRIFPFVWRTYDLSSTAVQSKIPIAVSCSANWENSEKVRRVSQKVYQVRFVTAVTKFRLLSGEICAILSGKNALVAKFYSFSKRVRGEKISDEIPLSRDATSPLKE